MVWPVTPSKTSLRCEARRLRLLATSDVERLVVAKRESALARCSFQRGSSISTVESLLALFWSDGCYEGKRRTSHVLIQFVIGDLLLAVRTYCHRCSLPPSLCSWHVVVADPH